MAQNLVVDYLVMSFKISSKQSCFLTFLLNKINFPLSDSEEIKSYYGLKKCYFYGGIKIHVNPDLVVFDMSGKGCRTCEQLNKNWDWYGFLSMFDKFLTVPIKNSDYKCKGQFAVHISRIDLASDLLDDSRITLPFLWRYIRKNQFICKSNYHSIVEGNFEQAVYFGSPRSDRRLRIYDKALEQGLQDTKWVRFEFQLRNDNATSFYLNLCQLKGDFVKCYFGMLHDYLRFTTKPNLHDGNQSNRLKVCSWWLKFLQGVERIQQLYLPGDDYDIAKATQIYARQCSSTVKTLLNASGGDITEIIKTAENAKLNKKQRNALIEWDKRTEDEKAAAGTAAILQAIGDSTPKRTLSRKDMPALMAAGQMERKWKNLEEYYKKFGKDEKRCEWDKLLKEDLPF